MSTPRNLMKFWRDQKDKIIDHGKRKFISPASKKRKLNKFKKLLDKIEISDEISNLILKNASDTNVIEYFDSAMLVLRLLKEHGLKGKAADEFFKGGHFIFKDDGNFFNKLQKSGEIRFSSHFPDSRIEEKGISCGRILPEVLILVTKDSDNHIRSHIQAEASPWRSGKKNYLSRQALHTSEHITDSAWYFANKLISKMLDQQVMNLGPYGWSEHDDNNPIVDMNLPAQEKINMKELLNAFDSPKGYLTTPVTSKENILSPEIEQSKHLLK